MRAAGSVSFAGEYAANARGARTELRKHMLYPGCGSLLRKLFILFALRADAAHISCSYMIGANLGPACEEIYASGQVAPPPVAVQ